MKTELVCILFIGGVVITGLMSTFFAMEYWTIYCSHEGLTLQGKTLEAMQKFMEVLKNNPRSAVLTISTQSLEEAMMAGSGVALNDKWIWSAKSPETALIMFAPPALFIGQSSYPDFKPPHILNHYIYIRKRDLSMLKDEFKGNYMTHILAITNNKIVSNKEVTIYEIPRFSAPRFEGDTALVLIPEYSPPYIVYDILSFSGVPYTTLWSLDAGNLADKKTIILVDDQIHPTELELLLSEVRLGKKLVIVNLCHTSFLRNKLFTEDSVDETEVILSDDNQSDFWIALAQGRGNISIPALTDSKKSKTGIDSLRIDVKDGIYSQWIIKHMFSEPQDWSEYEFLTFYWFGKGTKGKIAVVIHGTAKDEIVYYFDDDWYGWKKVLLPLRASDGFYILGDLEIFKDTMGEPSLAHVEALSLRNSTLTPNLKGTWYIDRVSLLKLNRIFNSMMLKSGKVISMPYLMVGTFIQENEAEVEAWFIDNLGYKSPFVLRKTFGQGEVIYVDFSPVIYSLQLNGQGIESIVRYVRPIFDLVGLIPEPKSEGEREYVFDNAFLFYNATLIGNVTLSSDFFTAVVIEEKDGGLTASFTTSNGLWTKVYDVRKIVVTGKQITLLVPNMNITGGYGFYTKFIPLGDAVLFKGTSQLYMETYGSILKFDVKDLLIHLPEISTRVSFYARSPQVNISGVLIFTDPNLKVISRSGVISFKISLSDNISVAQDFSTERKGLVNIDLKVFVIYVSMITIFFFILFSCENWAQKAFSASVMSPVNLQLITTHIKG